MRNWKPEDIFDIKCPWCKQDVEFWKDEPRRACPACRRDVRNPRIDLGCAKWCKSAAECLGITIENPEILASVRERLLAALKDCLAGDENRIEAARRVLANAEALLECENADAVVVKAAAILRAVETHEAKEPRGSAAGPLQERETPPMVRSILESVGLEAMVIEHVCRIVDSPYSGNDLDTPEFRIVWDADWLERFPTEFPKVRAEALNKLIDGTFRTKKGQAMAREKFISGKGP
ncbi:MAG: phosphohydrolase [Acidobacteria bacterium]|nr:phosphohydrolase [Acidobacteriota bacterium]MBI3657159.1 phosphohydrolase [Acidobacteriota bacterium]